jgi:hypothetical protein
LSEAIQDKALDTAMLYVASKGVTSAHNMYGYTKAFERAHDAGRMITRIYAVENLSDWSNLKSKVDQQGHGDKWLRYGGLKGFVDGSLGSHTAAFFKPFTDAPTDSGFFITPEKDLYEWASAADKAGLQVMIHAIGDKAINTLLNIYERIEKENGPRDRRFRIEHARLEPLDQHDGRVGSVEHLLVNPVRVPENGGALVLLSVPPGELPVLVFGVVDLVPGGVVDDGAPVDAHQASVKISKRVRDAVMHGVEPNVEVLQHGRRETLVQEGERAQVKEPEEAFGERLLTGDLWPQRIEPPSFNFEMLRRIFEDVAVLCVDDAAWDAEVAQQHLQIPRPLAREADPQSGDQG